MSEIYHRFRKDDVDQFMDNDIYLPTRTVYMGSQSESEGQESGVDFLMAERVIKGLHILDSQATNGDKPITILMNNPGGDVYHGMAIFDAIQNCKNHVTVKAYGYVMSMGSIIIQAADYRTMSKNSKMMIHYGENGFHGHAKIAQKIVEDIKEFDRKMEDMFLEKMTGRKITIEEYLTLVDKKDEIPKGNAKNKLIEIDRERLREMLNFDTFLTPKMALKLNLIDAILER